MTTEFQLESPPPFAPVSEVPKIFVPLRDGDGWYPITDDQSLAEVGGYFSEHPPEPKHREPRDLLPGIDWDSLGKRGEVATGLYAAGLKSKAHRFADCYRNGIPYDCCNPACLTKAFGRFHCGCRFCEYCGPMLYRELMDKYAGLFSKFVAERKSHEGYTLARLNFTMKATGDVPTPEEIKRFNRAIRRALKMAVPKDESGGLQYGVAWSDEFGYELRGRKKQRVAGGLNLHAHALYYGPRLSWRVLRDAWVDSLQHQGLEGQGLWVTFLTGWRNNPARFVWGALAHMLKYISKVAAKTPERTVALELAFNHVRRVHTGGLFYNLPDEGEARHQSSPACPRCNQPMVRADGARPWERFPVECFEREGRRDLAELRREKGLGCNSICSLWEGGP